MGIFEIAAKQLELNYLFYSWLHKEASFTPSRCLFILSKCEPLCWFQPIKEHGVV